MEFAVLGPLQVTGPDGPVDIVGAKERAVLAHLVAAEGRMLSTDELIDNLWGEEPPRTATKSLQNYVLRLRKVLEPDRNGRPQVLVTDGRGYHLAVPDEAVDARRFARLVDLGRRALADQRPEAAAQILTEALDLWRGPAYAGLPDRAFGGEARRLEELRIAATEDRIAAQLAQDLEREAVPELEQLVHEHPLRERLWHLLVLALYRSGRQADALATYSRAREVLLAELGADPGEELRRLHAQVLAQDPALLPRRPTPRLPAALRRPPGPFVGRDEQLLVLQEAWEATRQGRPQSVVLRGPPGAGARRLAAELADVVVGQGFQVEYVSAPGDPLPPVIEPTLTVLDGADLSVPGDGPRLFVLLHGHAGAVPADARTVVLPPLAADDVHQILDPYLAGPVDEETLRRVLRDTGGMPGRVHDAALALVGRRIHERVENAAVRTSRMQTALAAARDQLTEGVAEFGGHLERSRPIPDDVCPWKGLVAYEVADAPWFAGRERLVAELLTRVASSPLLALVGPSGSGKSSLLRAGLLASVAAGALPGSDRWLQLVMRPGQHPLRELVRVTLQGRRVTRDDVAELLEHLVFDDSEGGTVLVVDQLEEVWTTCPDPAERQAFLDALSDLASPGGGSRCRIVLALRADYVGELANHQVLARALSDATVLVGAPSEAEVRRTVEHPAARAGLALDTGLVDALVSDAGAEPGVLPLLSTALAEMWEGRDGDRLTLGAYVRAGGLRGAVARIAERAYEALDPDDRAAARVLLLRLAGPGEADAATRRRVPFAELAALPDPRVAAVVGPLADARLLSLGAGHVEVAHEALFREWPRLAGWLAEDAEARAVQRRLVVAAAEWDAGGREDAQLWRGSRLVAGVDFAAAHADEVTDVERTFVERGLAQQEAEQRAAEARAAAASRQNRRLRLRLGGLAALLAVALVAGFLAIRAGSRAEREATVAQARALAANSVAAVPQDPELAVLLALKAVERARPVGGTALREAGEALHRALASSRILSVLSGTGGAADWSPAGGSYAVKGVTGGGSVEIHDAVTGATTRSWTAHEREISDLAYSADGALLATTGLDGALKLWDPGTGRLVRTLQGAPGSRVVAPSFSPDGRLVAASWHGDDGVARVWDVATGALVREFPTRTGAEPSLTTAFSPDGTQFAFTFDGYPRVVDLATGRTVFDLPAGQYTTGDIEWSPDGRFIASVDTNYLFVDDAATGHEIARAHGHRSFILAVTWSPDSRRLATGSLDGTAKVWDVDAHGVDDVTTLSAASTRPAVAWLAFSPDGGRLLTGTQDPPAVTVWDVGIGGDAEVATYPVDTEGFAGLDYTPDGDRLVIGTGAGEVTVRDTTTGQIVQHMGPHAGMPGDTFRTVYSVDVSPDGSMIALTDSDLTMSVWDAETGAEVFTHGLAGWADSVAWSPDSRVVAAASWGTVDTDSGGQVVVLDRAGREVARQSSEEPASFGSVEFSPDGRLLAYVRGPFEVARDNPAMVELWDWRRDAVVRRIAAPGQDAPLGFSPDGQRVVVTQGERATVVEVSSGAQMAQLTGSGAAVISLAYSPDGSLIATGHEDGLVRLWDADSGRTVTVLPGLTSRVKSVVFSPDGRWLAASDGDAMLRVWAVRLDDLVALARAEVTRDLSADECRLYLQAGDC